MLKEAEVVESEDWELLIEQGDLIVRRLVPRVDVPPIFKNTPNDGVATFMRLFAAAARGQQPAGV